MENIRYVGFKFLPRYNDLIRLFLKKKEQIFNLFD